MSDITHEQFQDFIDLMRKQTGELTRMANGGQMLKTQADKATKDQATKRDTAARKKINHDFDNMIRKTTDHLGLLSGHADELSHALVRFAEFAVPGGVIMGSIVRYGTNLVRHYREMIDVGQTFSGSLTSMARSAAQAGMPLEDFAQFVKKNSQIMATYGVDSVSQFALQVRKASLAAGNYGYTVDELGDVSAKYLDIQRIFGKKIDLTNKGVLKSMAEGGDNFAKQLTNLSGVWGRDRKDIAKDTEETVRDPRSEAAMASMTKEQKNAYLSASTIASQIKSPALRKMLVESAAYGPQVSDTVGEFNKAGINLYPQMEAWLKRIRAGDTHTEDAAAAVMSAFQKGYNTPGVAANMAANKQINADVGSLYDEIGNRNPLEALKTAEIQAKNMKNMTDMTSSFLSLGDRMKMFAGTVLDNVLKPLEKFDQAISKYDQTYNSADEATKKKIDQDARNYRVMLDQASKQKTLAEQRTYIADQNKALDAKNQAGYAEMLQSHIRMQDLTDTFTKVGSVFMARIADMTSHISADKIISFMNAVGGAADTMWSIVKRIDGFYKNLFPKADGKAEGLTIATLVGGALAAVLSGKLVANVLLGALSNFIGKNVALMRVKAASVIVDGMGLGGAAGKAAGTVAKVEEDAVIAARNTKAGKAMAKALLKGVNEADRAPTFIGKLMARAGGIAGKAGEAVEGLGIGAKLGTVGRFAGIGMKAGGKFLGKAIPVLAIVSAVVSAAQRFKDHDAIGAVGEILGGLLSFIPGLGPFLSIGVSAILTARDHVGQDKFDGMIGATISTVWKWAIDAGKTAITMVWTAATTLLTSVGKIVGDFIASKIHQVANMLGMGGPAATPSGPSGAKPAPVAKNQNLPAWDPFNFVPHLVGSILHHDNKDNKTPARATATQKASPPPQAATPAPDKAADDAAKAVKAAQDKLTQSQDISSSAPAVDPAQQSLALTRALGEALLALMQENNNLLKQNNKLQGQIASHVK